MHAPEIRQFPAPIQTLIVIELEAVAERIAEEKTHMDLMKI
jgi:hypothetical protein